MNGTLVVRGGRRLTGTATPIPNKNSIVAVLPACIITNKTVIYKDLPKTLDVEKELAILKKLGAKVDDRDYKSVSINCSSINTYEVDPDLGRKFRASIMFAGALLARFGKAKLPLPGGCVLGFRSIAAHIDVFSKVGITVEFGEDFVIFTAPKKLASEYNVWQLETSVTATENFAIYAAGTKSAFTLTNAASEPHVSSVLKLLADMGAYVSGIDSNKISISGGKLTRNVEFVADPDFVDITGYIVAAAITKGKIRLTGANIPSIIDNLIVRFSLFNIKITKEKKDIIIDGSNELFIDTLKSGIPLAGENMPKIKPEPWPGLQVDLIPIVATLCCKTKGRILLQNWMYETGLDFIRELNKLGADIFMCDPQRVIITGPVKFKGGEIVSPGIIQACMAIFLAALSDSATTVIHGADVLKRRYPDLVTVYRSLGADIEEINVAQ